MNLLKPELGQYFTTNKILQEKLYDFINNNPIEILEPSVGRGDLVNYISQQNKSIRFDMYEIDSSIEMIVSDMSGGNLTYGDFLTIPITKKYDTIVGNPPYIRTKTGNLYIDFIEKCFTLLNENGELIFIIPSDFFKLTSASQLLQNMLIHGTFTHIFHPHNERFFIGATIDILLFRYCKNRDLEKIVSYNDFPLTIINNNGMVTFEENNTEEDYILFQDYFDVYVGIVSGKDEIYKTERLGNIEVLNGKNKIEKFIYISEYPCGNNEIDNYLLHHKRVLLERKIKKFNENNWFEWGAPRNIETMRLNMGRECIYIANLSRQKEVAFLSTVQYFGGSLLLLLPKTECNLIRVVQYLNSEEFKTKFMYSNRFKIGQRQMLNSRIPKKYLELLEK